MRQKAAHLWAAADGVPERFVKLAAAAARDCIRYETDTARIGGEDIAGFTRPRQPSDPVDAWMRGIDDCDAKARFFCALCLAREIPAEMVDHWQGEKLKHVYTRVCVDGRWMPVETTLARARVGDIPWDVPKEKNGQWLRT